MTGRVLHVEAAVNVEAVQAHMGDCDRVTANIFKFKPLTLGMSRQTQFPVDEVTFFAPSGMLRTGDRLNVTIELVEQ